VSLLSGQRAFVAQRLSALVLLAFAAAAAGRLAFGPSVTLAQWQDWVAQPFGAALVLLMAAALFAHAWVGIRDVALDYVRPLPLRLAVLAVVAAGLVLLAAWTVLILVSHAL
jgi:succinate dehydrogenase / fumarate reductase membrane anchor subunit